MSEFIDSTSYVPKTSMLPTLLATDAPQSVIRAITDSRQLSFAYNPFGFSVQHVEYAGGLGFNGQRRDAITGCYHLGSGARVYNPVLLRFMSPDSLSPFGVGGLNPYGYCSGDPVNKVDPTGHVARAVFGLLQTARRRPPPGPKALKRLQRKPWALDVTAAGPSATSTAPSSAGVYPRLENRKIAKFQAELETFNQNVANNPRSKHEQLWVQSVDDLKRLSRYQPNRFVFTRGRQLLVDAQPDMTRRGINHAIMAHHSGSEIIAAGTIAGDAKHINLWNDSGHYHPDFATLTPVAEFLQGLGATVHKLRIM